MHKIENLKVWRTVKRSKIFKNKIKCLTCYTILAFKEIFCYVIVNVINSWPSFCDCELRLMIILKQVGEENCDE